MLYSFRFFISWIVSAVIMYSLFYVWHGVFLNDLDKISFNIVLFLLLASLVYLVISFVIYRTYESSLLKKYITKPMSRGVVSGIMVGFVLFAIVSVLGISFTHAVNTKFIIVDCAWQIIEQIVGGLIVGLGKMMIFEPNSEDLVHD